MSAGLSGCRNSLLQSLAQQWNCFEADLVGEAQVWELTPGCCFWLNRGTQGLLSELGLDSYYIPSLLNVKERPSVMEVFPLV